MGLSASIRGFVRVMARDLQVARRGAWPGWYALTHYRGRWQARRDRPASVASARLRAGNSRVRVFVTPHHLGPLYGIFVEGEYRLDEATLGFAPRTILDLGANAGMAAAYLAACFPAARVLCVEPDPRNLPLLERTLAANGVGATVAAVAVAAHPGRLRLRTGANPTCSALETSPMHDLADGVDVEVKTVPRLLAEAGWDGADLVKMDIEGTERELLSDANGWLAGVKAIILEIHPNTSPAEIGGFLAPFGFRLARFGHGGEPVYLARRP